MLMPSKNDEKVQTAPCFGLGQPIREVLSQPKNWSVMINEAAKGEVAKTPAFNDFLTGGGIQHPFKFKLVYDLYNNRSTVHGAIDKTVDAVVSAGFTVESDNEKAAEIIEEFLQKTSFKNVLRRIVKDALICGNAFVEIVPEGVDKFPELINWDSCNFFVKRDKKKTVTNYVQMPDNFSKKGIDFDPDQIAHFTWNQSGDDAYGIGMVYPNLHDIDREIGLENSIMRIIKRKGNQPIHVKMGDENFQAQKSDIDSMANKLYYMEDRTEYVTNHLVEMEVLNFGQIIEKFEPMLEHVHKNLLTGFQVPEVILTGWGSIAEGLAKVQLDTFRNERIRAIREEFEVVIEEKIFSKVLAAYGITDAFVEFVWGDQSEKDKRENLETLRELLKLVQTGGIGEGLRKELEKKVADLLGIEYDPDLMPPMMPEPEEEPVTPLAGGEEEEELEPSAEEKLYEYLYKKEFGKKPKCIHEYRCFDKHKHRYEVSSEMELLEMGLLMEKSEQMSMKEYTRREYDAFLPEVENFLLHYDFDEIADLTIRQKGKLRQVMVQGFEQDMSMRQLSNKIKDDVKIKPLERRRTNPDGSVTVFQVNEQRRADMIARTESVRAANNGALEYFKKEGVKAVEWYAHMDERTCPVCDAFNGSRFTTEEALGDGLLPAHTLCRCEMRPVT